MRKTCLLTTIVLLSAILVVAQQTPTSQSQTAQPAGAENQATVIEGCLASSSGGGFALTDQGGNSHPLAGASAELSGLVGQQIRVTGTEGASDSQSAASTDGSHSHGIFKVAKIEKVADTCSNAKK